MGTRIGGKPTEKIKWNTKRKKRNTKKKKKKNFAKRRKTSRQRKNKAKCGYETVIPITA